MTGGPGASVGEGAWVRATRWGELSRPRAVRGVARSGPRRWTWAEASTLLQCARGCWAGCGSGPKGRGDGPAGFWVLEGFCFSFLISNSNKFEFKFEFEFKHTQTIKTMHQHECNKNLNL
jgi:hypothetical protein